MSKKFNRNSNIISGLLQDELVMMNIEKGKYFSLNKVATRIWEIIETPLSIEQLVTMLMEEYEIDEVQCRADVEDYLKEMLKLGLILEA